MLWQTPDEVLDDIIDRLVVDHRADAIITHNDFVASALLKRLRKRGIRVPEDVAVIGYLNHYLCEYVDPPLTSVDLRHHFAAKSMVQAIQEMIDEGSDAHQLATCHFHHSGDRRAGVGVTYDPRLENRSSRASRDGRRLAIVTKNLNCLPPQRRPSSCLFSRN